MTKSKFDDETLEKTAGAVATISAFAVGYGSTKAIMSGIKAFAERETLADKIKKVFQ